MSRIFPLYVSPSEALLLGFCVGEYELLLDINARPVRFINVLERRLLPYFEERCRRFATEQIALSDVPAELTWVSVQGTDFEIACQRHPEPMLFRRSWLHVLIEECEQVRLRSARGTGFDRIIDGLREHMAWTVREELLYPGFVSRGLPDVIAKIELLLENASEEAPAAIVAWCNQIVNDNDCRQSFEAGRRFGIACAQIESFICDINRLVANEEERQFNDLYKFIVGESAELRELNERMHSELDEFSREQVRAEYLQEQERIERLWEEYETFVPMDSVHRPESLEKYIVSLRTLPIVQACFHADELLNSLTRDRWRLETVGADDGLPFAASSRAMHAQMVLWLAFGEVLGALRDADHEESFLRSIDYLPDRMAISPAETPDGMRKELEELQASLINAKRAGRAPWEVIVTSARYIEALVKRVWPEEFKSRKSRLHEVLRRMTIDARGVQQDFAYVARHLYKQCRNPAMHEAGKKEFSEIEARYYVSGVQFLVEMWEEIRRSRETREEE